MKMISEIYCHGDLLHTIQMSRIFEDSKTFVDMKLKQKPEITLQLYKEFMAKHDGKPAQEDIRKFVTVSFEQFSILQFVCHRCEQRILNNEQLMSIDRI